MQDALIRQYIDSLKTRVERIDSLLTKLADGNSKAEENIRLLGHSLHGSGASFGFPDITEAGKAVEHADTAGLEAALQALKAVLEKVIADHAGAPTTAPEKKPASSKPADQQASPAQAKAASDVDDQEKTVLKILVVDDDAQMSDMICTCLKNLPKKQDITVAETGAKAQQLIVSENYDLIVMDLMLPDRDGRELIKEMKLEFQLHSPLLVLSSIQSDAVRVECMTLGADKFLAKPFYEEDLLHEAKKLLGKKAQKKLTLVPKDGETVPEEDDEAITSDVLEGFTILVADDDKMMAKLINQRLAAEGAAIKLAHSGPEAMQLLRTVAFSLVILDVKMPMLDGFEVLERIQNELKLTMPVIMVTSMGSEEDIIKGYELGATDYILKPFSEVQLIARVKSLLKTTSVKG